MPINPTYYTYMTKLKMESTIKTLVDLAEEAIFHYIKEKKLQPGEKILFDEYQLAEQLNVSRNVVREALSRLHSFGIIDSRKRKGMVLKEPDFKKNITKIIDPEIYSKEKNLDMLELRYILEIGIIPSLFENIKEKDIDDLKKILPMEVSTSNNRMSIEREIQFHSRIYQITNNQIIMDMQELLIPVYRFVYNNYADFDTFNDKIKKENLQATHYDIIEALAKGDKDLYKDVIQRHLMAYQLYIKEQKLKRRKI